MTVELSVAFYNDKLDPKPRTIFFLFFYFFIYLFFFLEIGAICKKSYREIIVRNVVRTRGSPEGFAEYKYEPVGIGRSRIAHA